MDYLANISFLFFGLLILIAYSWWAVRDANRRRKSPLLVLAAVVLFFPFGLIAWLLFRPPYANIRPGGPTYESQGAPLTRN